MKKRLSAVVVLSASSPPPPPPNSRPNNKKVGPPPEDPGGAFGGGGPMDVGPAPDPVGFSPVRGVSGCWLPPPPPPTTTTPTPVVYAAPKSSLFGSPPRRRPPGGRRGSSSSVVTPPTEDDDEENDVESGEESPAGATGLTSAAAPAAFPAWGSSHRKSATTSLFEMDDDDSDSDSDGEFGNNAPTKVKYVGRHRVTCLAPPALVTSTTADSFDFSVVGWGTAGTNAGSGAAALGGNNQKIGEANPSSLFRSPPSTPAAGGGVFPPSHRFGDDVVSPLAMASPLAERCDKLYKGKPAGEAPTAVPFPAFTPLEVGVPQEPPQKTSHHKAVVEAPDSPSLRSFLLHTCRSLSHGDLRSSVRCPDPDAAPTTVADNADADADADASTTPSRRRLVMVRKAPTSASTSSRALTPSSRASRRRLSGGTTSMTAAEAAASKCQAGTTGPVPTSKGVGASTRKTTRTLKVRSKDVASLVGALMPPRSPTSSEPPPTPSKSLSSPRGTDLRTVWDAFRKATANKAPSAATPPNRRSKTRMSGRDDSGEGAAEERPAPTSSPDVRVRSRSRSSSLRTTEAGGRARSRSSTRPTRSPSFRRKSLEEPDAEKVPTSGHAERTDRFRSLVRGDSKRRREPDGFTAPDPEVKPSPKPVRRSRSFGSTSSPGESSRLSRATSYRDLEKRLVGPGEVPPRQSSCRTGSQSHVADGARRRRSSSRTPVPHSEGGEDVRNQRRKSSSGSSPAPQADAVPAPPRRRSTSRSSDGSSGRHSALAVGAGTTDAFCAGVPGPPDLRRTGSEAAREVGISNEQLRLLQSAGMRILPQRESSRRAREFRLN